MRILSRLRSGAAIAAVCVASLFCSVTVHAQYTAVTTANLGGSGSKTANATIYWQPVSGCTSNAVIGSARAGSSSGQIQGTPYSATVTTGASSVSVPDALLAAPNIGYAVTAVDNTTGTTIIGAGLASDGVHVNLGGPYGCVQPTGSTWNFDAFIPGSTGATGSPLLTWRGAWSSGISYSVGDAVSYNGSSFANTLAGNTNNPGSPTSPGTGWALLSSMGASGVGTDPSCHTDGSGNLTCGTVSANTITSPSVNKILAADSFTGATVDLRIAAAFASMAGTLASPTTSVEVDLSPGQTYTITNSITIPNNLATPYITAPVLDCKGATINYTGTGIPIQILPENAIGPGQSGELRNCKITGPTADGAQPVIQASSRLGFIYSNLTLANGSACLDLENTTNSGGMGYTEQTSIHNLTTQGCLSHLYLHAGTGAKSSFEHNWWDGGWHCELTPGEKCFDAGTAGTVAFDTQDTRVSMIVNTDGGTSASTGYAVWVDNGNQLFRGVWHIGGENTAGWNNFYSVFVNSAGSLFYNEGNIGISGALVGFGTGVFHSTFVMHSPLMPVSNDFGSNQNNAHWEPEEGVLPERHCKFDIGATNGTFLGGSALFWLARYGGTEDDCSFQIVSRSTSSATGDQDVDIKGTSGSAEQNDLYVDSLSGNVGIGPGWGNGFPSGSVVPPSPNSTANEAGVYNMTTTAFMLRRITTTMTGTPSNTIFDFWHAIGSTSGQDSAPYCSTGYDYKLLEEVQGFCVVYGNGPHYYFGGSGGAYSAPLDTYLAFFNGPIGSTSITVGSGNHAFTRHTLITATLSPAAVAANTCAAQSLTATGINAGDIVLNASGVKPTFQAGLMVGGVLVTGANTVSINFCNVTAASITPTASETYTFDVEQ